MKKQIENFSFFGVRYIINDLDQAVAFYQDILGFTVEMKVAPGFAKLSKGNLNLYLNKAGYGGAGQTIPDGKIPAPGGCNRIQLVVHDLEKTITMLKAKKTIFRNELVKGQGGNQILLEDPSGNLIELCEPNEQTK